MTDYEQVLMNRDGLSEAEAREQRDERAEEIFDALGNGASYDDIEDLLMSDGLEMDYIFDLI